jgi:hypothetical protein
MNVRNSTGLYESWLAKHLTLIPADLELKHAGMAKDLFRFLRGTFYRWIQCWPEVCPEEANAPEVLAVGDLHVENYGTWRDAEGRLIWGINDFDEAFELPYTQDLIRVATSAHVAIRTSQLRIGLSDACNAILEGYKEGLESKGRPFVLEEHHKWLRETVTSELRDPVQFWAKFDALETIRTKIPSSARKAIERMLPGPFPPYRLAHRIAGMGSLGRERYVAIAEYHGARIAREAKALAPSACVWAATQKVSNRILYGKILEQSVRALDPFVQLKGRWIVRRLSPHCSRVELASIEAGRDEIRLLRSMGFEAANIHLGTDNAGPMISRDLRKRRADWLHTASEKMLRQTTQDWAEWRQNGKSPKA